jgi:hypothetical protein
LALTGTLLMRPLTAAQILISPDLASTRPGATASQRLLLNLSPRNRKRGATPSVL